MSQKLWHKPSLHEHHPHMHRKVSWLELFFDLVFVVAIAQLAHHVAAHPSAVALGQFVFCMLPVWLVWNGTTYFNERFETKGLENRLQFFCLIAFVTVMASFTADPLGSQFLGFSLAYLAARGLNIILWLWAAWHHREFLPSSLRFALGYVIGAGCIVLALGRPLEERMLWWGLGLVAEFVGPLLSIWHTRKLPDFSSSKLPERMGLFVIIVLGEAIAGLVRGLQGTLTWVSPMTYFQAFLGLSIGFLGWWIYFDFVGRRTERRSNLWTWVWSYLHAPLIVVVAGFGALLEPALKNTPHCGPWLMGTIAAFLVNIALLEWTLKHSSEEPTGFWSSSLLKLICALVLALGTLAHPSAVVALVFGSISMLIPALYGLWVWKNHSIN